MYVRGYEEDGHNADDDFGEVSFKITGAEWQHGYSGEIRAQPSSACAPGCYILSYNARSTQSSGTRSNKYVNVTLISYLDLNHDDVHQSEEPLLNDIEVAWTCDENDNCVNNFDLGQASKFGTITFRNLESNEWHSFQMCRVYRSDGGLDNCAETGAIMTTLGDHSADQVFYMGWYVD